MCDYMYYEEARRHRAKRVPVPEPEKVEEKPILVKA